MAGGEWQWVCATLELCMVADDYTRVVLLPQGKTAGSDYINANFVGVS